jgi:hypothetical protein
MTPFEGQRRLDVRAEQVVWHLVSAGVLGLLVLLLLSSIALLDGAAPSGASPETPPKVARPIDEAAPAPSALETRMHSGNGRPGAHLPRTRGVSEQVRIRPDSRHAPGMGGEALVRA